MMVYKLLDTEEVSSMSARHSMREGVCAIGGGSKLRYFGWPRHSRFWALRGYYDLLQEL